MPPVEAHVPVRALGDSELPASAYLAVYLSARYHINSGIAQDCGNWGVSTHSSL